MPRITIPIHLRWGDLDAYGHVNNVTLLELLQEARVRAFWNRGGGDGPETAVIDADPGTDSLTLIARQEVEYLLPIPYLTEPISIEMWLTKLGGSSIEVAYEVRSPASGEERLLYARAATVIVFIDAQTQRPRRLGRVERAAWEPYVGEPIAFRRG
ncbi:MAG TPA: thioesterase family protein [Microbacteriaceae bacterium]|nr:thioesterase family protein [Microbacteriaceae bacterium]